MKRIAVAAVLTALLIGALATVAAGQEAVPVTPTVTTAAPETTTTEAVTTTTEAAPAPKATIGEPWTREPEGTDWQQGENGVDWCYVIEDGVMVQEPINGIPGPEIAFPASDPYDPPAATP
jgi:hypothetical protein